MKSATTVGERGQVTIPKPLRRRLGIGPGTKLQFELRHGELVARMAGGEDPLDALVGIGVAERTDRFLRQTRGAPFQPERDGGR